MKLSKMKATKVADDGQGRWVDDIPGFPGVRLKVRLFNNDDDKRIQREATDALPLSTKLRGKADKPQQDAIMAKRLLGAILVDWDGLEDDSGAPMLFSREAAETLLSDPDLEAFRDAVAWAATLAGAEAIEGEQASAKN